MKPSLSTWAWLTVVLVFVGVIWLSTHAPPAAQSTAGNYGPGNPLPAARTSIAWKTAWAITQTQEIETALSLPIPTTNPDAPYISSIPITITTTPFHPYSTPLPDGGVIVNNGQTTMSNLVVRNKWYKDQDGIRTFVDAGAVKPPDDAHDRTIKRGMVLVRTHPLTNLAQTTALDIYYTPQEAGAVRIIAAAGMRLFLRSDTGIPFTFNVASRQYEPASPPPTP